MILFVMFIWVVATINLAAGINVNLILWIDERDYPGGPIHYIPDTSLPPPIYTLGSATYITINCLTDFVMVGFNISSFLQVLGSDFCLSPKLHLALIIWGYNYYVIAMPFLAVLVSTGELALLR